jgi:catechol 2,3-dioxygenase-like lactoylglutathione lyase family enzyme
MSAVFAVTDVAASLAYYRDRLGFEVLWQDAEPPRYAVVWRDAVSLHLQAASRSPDAQAACGRSAIYVFADSVDRLHGEIVAAGGTIEVPPTDFFYGMREMSVRDLDGNRITYGQEVARH